MSKPTFDAGGFLAQEGLELSRVDDGGNYYFNTPDGQEVNLDATAYLKSKGVPTDKLDIEWNTPDSALDQSPVGLVDRAKMALGNTKGQIAFLKNRFDDVSFKEGEGLLVKNKGVWQKVDKEGMDPWELTKDIVEGAVGFVPSAAAATVGAAKAAAVAAPAGPLAMAGAGIVGAGTAGAGAEAMRTSLGRLVGTYDATPEEQLKDVGIEFLLNAGGQTIIPGAKLVLPQLAKAAKSIAAATNIAPASKNILATALGRTTGAGEVATATLLEAPDAVVSRIAKVTAGGAGPEAAIAQLKGESIKAAQAMLEEAPKALSRKFGETIDVMTQAAGPEFKADVGGLVKLAQKQLEASGLGKFVSLAPKSPKTIQGLSQVAPEVAEKKLKFRLLTDNEVLAKRNAGEATDFFTPETKEHLETLVSQLNKYSNLKAVKGPGAVRSVMDLKRSINEVVDEMIHTSKNPTVKRAATQFKQAMSQQISDLFHSQGPKVAAAYKQGGALYQRFEDAVTTARRMADAENGAETLLTRLYQGAGMNQTYKDLAGDMVSLLGESGKKYMSTIKLNQAAAAFTPWAPHTRLAQLGTTAAAGYAAANTDGAGDKALVAGAGLAMMSPKLVAKQVQYAFKGLEWMKSLPPPTRVKWLQNPDAVRETFKAIAEPAMTEDQDVETLLQQAGVK